MSLNRFRAQQTVESFYGGTTTQQWADAKPNEKVLSKPESNILLSSLSEDAKDLYFKGVISLAEAVDSFSTRRYSWATVKLYYSLFYFLRCSLACYGVVIIRCKKGIFYARAREGEAFLKIQERTDHKATIMIFSQIYGNGDILQSNQINGVNPYEWLMIRREEVNYKDREFHEPLCPHFIEKVDRLITKDGLDALMETYISDPDYIYCFQEEDAILALPLKRMLLTQEHMRSKGIVDFLSHTKKSHITSLLGEDTSIASHFIC